MATRRQALSTLVRAPAASCSSSSLLRGAVCRQCRQPQPQPQPQPQSRRVVGIATLMPRTGMTPGFGDARRRYSHAAAAAAADSKIWTFEDVEKLTKNPRPNVVLIDAREPSELQETGRIPGAVNMPIKSAPDSFHIRDDEFEDRFGYPRPSKDAEVVIYCRAGVRSRAAAEMARDAGWTKVGEYPGSWLDWAEKGGEVER